MRLALAAVLVLANLGVGAVSARADTYTNFYVSGPLVDVSGASCGNCQFGGLYTLDTSTTTDIATSAIFSISINNTEDDFDLNFSPGGGGFLLDDASGDILSYSFLSTSLSIYDPSLTLLYSSGEPVQVINEGTSTTPLPPTLPLFATILAAVGLLGWLRKKAQAISV